ncbi:hypothetical protein N9B37_00780 [bacterium]|nr:hypothetical protein [Mariniblastus sp.]MDA7913349.1 hypothetical protein [bacterium]
MRYIGYVAKIDDNVDAVDLDFETTDYCETDSAIVSSERIRLEWMEGDEQWAITINQIYENDEGEFGAGLLECTYPSWEGRRNIQKQESGRVNATIIADDDENEFHELDEFWLDVEWTTGLESGRLVFELARP